MVNPVYEVVKRRGTQVSIVIPAHNKAENLPYVLPLIPTWVDEIILVNDHSTDNTVEIASQLVPTIHILNTRRGRGKGAALQTGFAEARGDIIVMMDADGSSDPREISRFIEALLDGAYFARGSRFIRGGGSDDITLVRRFGSCALIAIANLLFRMRSTDMFCGLNAFWKGCFDFFEIDCEGFEVEALIHLRVRKANLEIVEVPSYEHARIQGVSKFRLYRDGWRVLMTIVKEWLNGSSVIGTHRMYHQPLRESHAWDNSAVTEHIGATQ